MRRRTRIEGKAVSRQPFQLARHAVAAGVQLDENPNRVKRGASRLDYMGQTLAQLQRETERAYSPLMVSTPVRDSLGRRNPRMGATSYTV